MENAIQSASLHGRACDTWISCSTVMKFAGWSKTQIRNHVGHNWHAAAKKVMQFLSEGRYVAVVVGGKVISVSAKQMDDVLQCMYVPLAGIPRTQIRK